jgi:hypothetical protein
MVETEGKDGWDLMVESFDPEGRVALEEACQLFKKNQHTTRSCAGPEDVISAFQQRHIFVFPAGAKAQTGGCCLGILGVIFVAFAIGGGVIGFRTGHYTYLINPIDAVILGIIGFITGPFGLWMFARGG